jgi:hypothetical protein
VGIAIGIVVLLAVGFWWTRGYGGPAGAPDDPAIEEQDRRMRGSTRMGEPFDPLATEHEDREHQVE